MAVAALALCGCGQNGTKKAGQATGADRDGHDPQFGENARLVVDYVRVYQKDEF